MESEKYFPSDFTQKELIAILPQLKTMFEQVKDTNQTLAKLLHTLWGEVLSEAFKKFAGDDQEKRQQLEKIINQENNH